MRQRLKCEICDFKATSQSVVEKHMQTTNKAMQDKDKTKVTKRINCDQCDKKFNKKETLNRHTEKIHKKINNQIYE